MLTTITVNKWHHIVVSNDGSRLRGFVDGVFVVQTSTTGSPVDRIHEDESGYKNPSWFQLNLIKDSWICKFILGTKIYCPKYYLDFGRRPLILFLSLGNTGRHSLQILHRVQLLSQN